MSVDLEAYRNWDSQNTKDKLTKAEIATKWINRWEAADRLYQSWAHRFKIPVLYQYYEGFQHLIEQDANNRPYVVNLIYSTIEQKLPNLLFDNPVFELRPHPYGDTFDYDKSYSSTQLKADALNYVIGREDFGFSDKHEIAILDAFFGFGVIETDYSKEPVYNANINENKTTPLDDLYCKQIPFDTFRVSSAANWDLSTGKWWGYYEYVPYYQLSKYIKEGKITKPPEDSDSECGDFADTNNIVTDGKVVVGENNDIVPHNCIKILRIEDFYSGKRLVICPDNAEGGDRLLEVEDFNVTSFSILRFGKRRKGWYPLPPAFNWLDPQDEINDIRQAQKIHRKRFSRKYGVMENAVDPDEMDKFLYGPDGTVIKFKRPVNEALQIIADGPMDVAADRSLQISYADMDRVSGATSDLQPSPDRETATSAAITNQRAQVRESKEMVRVANFLCSFARNTLRALGKAPASFWVPSRVPEGLLDELKSTNVNWVQLRSKDFRLEDYDVSIQISSISPVYQQEDKKTFLEFLAVISQYEILSISPALLREAAYRLGYKNSKVLNEFQQLAQLAMIGKIAQAKQQVAAVTQPPGPQPGQLPAAQVNQSTPPSLENIRNILFGLNENPGQSGGVQ
jgi:hypothetical protein